MISLNSNIHHFLELRVFDDNVIFSEYYTLLNLL
jgi:hypothetical protein